MRILIKIPTRQRPEQFFQMLDLYITYLKNTKDTSFLITCDTDDLTMNNDSVKNRFKWLTDFYDLSIIVHYGISNSKVEAINRDLHKYNDWDIMMLTSDDMYPVTEYYDKYIRKDMEDNFPDLDGVLYYPDGYTPLNTLPIIGKKYYERFNYIYYPEYISFFCDNEFHDVAEMLGKHYKSIDVLFKHEHPANTPKNAVWDELYERNNKSWDFDKNLFNTRRARKFGLENPKELGYNWITKKVEGK